MFANRIVSKLLPGADFSSNPMVVSELAVATVVPIAFLTVNVVVALAEHIVVAISQFAGNFYLIGLSEGFAMGTIFAQLVILAIWAGLSPTNTYLRAGYGLLMLVLGAQLVAMFTARFAPSVAALRNEWLTERGQFGWLLLVVVYSTVQLSLFAYRVWGGRYLAFQTLDSKAMKRQFSMLELVGLPVLVSFPLLVLPVFFEANIGLLIIAITFVSLFICLGYAALFLFGFLRERISIGIVTSLFVLGPVLLAPVSIYFTGSPTGSYQGIPFLGPLCAAHVGALAIGIPTALFARRIGYRLRQFESRKSD